MSRMRTNYFWLVVLGLVAVVVWTTPDSMAGERLSVRVDEPFEINGELFPAGKLSLREVRTLTPVATLHEVRVDGNSLGLLMVRPDGTTEAARNDEFIFSRSADGHLVLEALAVAGEPMGTILALGSPSGPRAASPTAPRPLEIASNR
jgi:hypothetical protein